MVDEPTTEAPVEDDPRAVDDIASDVLVEEVSIDGMCGVY